MNGASAAGQASDRAAYRRASPPLLPHPALDRLTRQHPAGPPLVFLPVIGTLLVLGLSRTGPAAGAALAVAGYTAWTLTEYWTHRSFFHRTAAPGTAWASVHWTVHGIHHEHPDDARRLVMPLAATVPLSAALCGLFRLAFGPELWMPFAAGFLGGYLLYDLVHYAVHHHRPRTRAGRALRRRHLLHHFHDDGAGFGVSAPWWDLVFRTAPRRGPHSKRLGSPAP